MKTFKVDKITHNRWAMEVSGGFYFSDLTFDTLCQLGEFLLNLGYEELKGE